LREGAQTERRWWSYRFLQGCKEPQNRLALGVWFMACVDSGYMIGETMAIEGGVR